jgi:hypothetical protein
MFESPRALDNNDLRIVLQEHLVRTYAGRILLRPPSAADRAIGHAFKI